MLISKKSKKQYQANFMFVLLLNKTTNLFEILENDFGLISISYFDNNKKDNKIYYKLINQNIVFYNRNKQIINISKDIFDAYDYLCSIVIEDEKNILKDTLISVLRNLF